MVHKDALNKVNQTNYSTFSGLGQEVEDRNIFGEQTILIRQSPNGTESKSSRRQMTSIQKQEEDMIAQLKALEGFDSIQD